MIPPRHSSPALLLIHFLPVRMPGPQPEFILVVDSGSISRQAAALVLRARGWPVLEARSAAEAGELFRTVCPAVRLLVIEAHLSDASGAALAEQLLAEQSTVAVLITHEGPAPTTRFATLAKPFPPGDLVRRAEELLRAAHGPGQNAS